MFDLKITDVHEAEALAYLSWPTRIVSLTGERDRNYGPHHLHVQVNDVAFVSQYGGSPSFKHLYKVLDFTQDLTGDDRLLMHCHAGISRSTAIAIAVCIQHGMDYKQAFDYVESVRNILMPNQLFIQYIDDHFQIGGKLVEYATEHRKNSLQKILILPSGPPLKQDVDSMKKLLQIMQDGP